MNKEMTYEESAKHILQILTELLICLGLQEGAILATFAILHEPYQQLALTDWIVEELEKRTLTEVEIMEKVESLEKAIAMSKM